MKLFLNESNSKLIGRSYVEQEVRWTALSGAGAAFRFQGKQLRITICGSNNAQIPNNNACYARYAALVNGERVIDDMLDREVKNHDVFSGDVMQDAEVQVMKLSESPHSAMGILPIECDEEAVVSPVSPKAHKIEFIGDSITCGYGTDDMDLTHTFCTGTEDVTKAYAYKTARLLDADYSMFSCSGYGIVSGYTPDPQVCNAENLIPRYYESQCFSRDAFGGAGLPEEIPWEFERYQPDVVVINLGTNDSSYCQDTEWKREAYREKYTEFLKLVRRHNPGAEIFCVFGLMGDGLYDKVCQAKEAYVSQTGDNHIHTVRIPVQKEEDGQVIDGHPTPISHTKAAEVVAAAIKKQFSKIYK